MKINPLRPKIIRERKKRERKVREKKIREKKPRIKKAPLKMPIKKEELKKGIYILPSLFTCGNMSLGILSILSSINGDFISAAWFLIGAIACDILDGRIARMTKTTTVFGMQLDTLSDLVSFGIAPAIMIYLLALQPMELLGIAIAVLFVLCSALRLARFNTLAQIGEIRKHFVGLPTPASAGVIISFVLSYELLTPEELSFNFKTIPVLMEAMPSFFNLMPVVMVILSLLMVSNVPYLSFKKMKLTKVRTIELLAVIIVLIILIIVFPQNIIFIIFTAYALSGLLSFIAGIFIRKKPKQANKDELIVNHANNETIQKTEEKAEEDDKQ